MNRFKSKLAFAVFVTVFVSSMAFGLLAHAHPLAVFIGPFSVVNWPSYLAGWILLRFTGWQFDPAHMNLPFLYFLLVIFCCFSAIVWSVLAAYISPRRNRPNQTPEPTPTTVTPPARQEARQP